jgi:hypothetical protein
MAEGGSWRLDVPAALAKCVGRYARIPEFAVHSHLLAFGPANSDAGD